MNPLTGSRTFFEVYCANCWKAKTCSCRGRRRSETRSLLLGDSEGLSSSTSGFGSLTSDLDVPVMTETSVLADLLHALEIFSESGVDVVGNQLTVGTILDAPLSVQEPLWNAVFYATIKLAGVCARFINDLPRGLAKMSAILFISSSESSPALRLMSI